MQRTTVLALCLLLALAGTAMAEPGRSAAKKTTVKGPASRESPAGEPAAAEQAAKQLSGMSIVGNDEAPKALYIVPWKSSEIGVETGMNMLLNESAAPVDREVFMRQLEFYEISTKK
ncbi:MAG: hypothetical protein ACYC7L_08280 [Nitrospirota bacterium]